LTDRSISFGNAVSLAARAWHALDRCRSRRSAFSPSRRGQM